jgi:4-diphosphocytidyl-2-C-methyl-D-erythritol kinase
VSVVVRERCRAKLNLFLDVVGRRTDGYHDLVTVFHEIDLADDLEIRESESGVTLAVEGDASGVPAGAENLAVRAARELLAEVGDERGVTLRLVKRIPVGGGLGGGSADAAGALRGVNRLFALGVPDDELERIALRIGSDVPFLVRGGTAVGRGRGELLDRVVVAKRPSFVLVLPGFAVSTAAVFAALPRTLPAPHDPATLVGALEAGDVDHLGRLCWNALLAPALHVEPRLTAALAAARAVYGPHVHLTGSGSTLFVATAAPRAVELPGGARTIAV